MDSRMLSLGKKRLCPAERGGYRWRWLLSGLLLATTDTGALAESPSLAFDFGRTAECAEVTSGDGNEVFPDEKIIELKLRVSLHLLSGSMDDVQEVRIEISDRDGRMRVRSFSPITRLESDLSEDIRWTKTTESAKSFGASLGARAPVPLGEVVGHVTPSVNSGLSRRDVVTETQKRVAPKHVVVASGTIDQEHGVFFKLRGSPQTSLEGVHALSVRFVVPENWRGDVVRVRCRATGKEKFLWFQQQATWATIRAPVVLYLAGDSEARKAAQRHANRADRS